MLFIVDGQATEEDVNSFIAVGGEVNADFPEEVVEHEIVRLDWPASLRVDESWITIFSRREPLA